MELRLVLMFLQNWIVGRRCLLNNGVPNKWLKIMDVLESRWGYKEQ